MLKKNLCVFVLLLTSFIQAEEGDLTLPGERWLAKSSGYICNAYEPVANRSETHEEWNVVFEQITTDYSLDNVLLKATFEEDGTKCRYSAILFADNAEQNIKLVTSKAYAVGGEGSCELGKTLLDQQLAFNKYLYWGHPHHASIMVPDSSASALCGEGATHIGIDFIVAGRINRNE